MRRLICAIYGVKALNNVYLQIANEDLSTITNYKELREVIRNNIAKETDEGLMAKSTSKQKAFCGEYLIDINATKVAIRSEYKFITYEYFGRHVVI